MKNTITIITILLLCQQLFGGIAETISAGDWDDPTIWDTGLVPSSTDDVYVEHRVDMPASYVATIKSLNTSTGGELYINTNAELTIIGAGFSTSVGITNKGYISNKGDITIELCRTNITNTGLFVNQKRGTINIDGGNNTSSSIGISNYTSNPNKFQNKGLIELNNLYTGIDNLLGVFTNFKIGDIHLNNCKIGLSNRGTFYNSGLFDCYNSDFSGINNRGYVRNSRFGTIDLEIADYVHFDITSITRNYGQLNISNCNTVAITLHDGVFFNQKVGSIDLTNNNGAVTLNPTTTFTNEGTFSMYDNEPNGFQAFQYYGLFVNEQCASFFTNDSFRALISPDSLINRGWIVQENEGGFDYADEMINYGVIDYEGDLTHINQDGIQVRSRDEELIENVIIYDALGFGDISYHDIEGWYTAENGSTVAGSYDETSNELTPNSDGAGLLSLWVRITNTRSGCTEDFEVEFTGSSTGGNRIFSANNFTNGIDRQTQEESNKSVKTLTLFSVSGQKLAEANSQNRLQKILDNLPQTIYLLNKLYDDGSAETIKIFSRPSINY